MIQNNYNKENTESETLTLKPDEPYAGLASFTEKNVDYFKGRDKEIGKILSRIDDKILTVVYGKSGIGKSSIIRAGIFPELRKKLYLPIDIKWDLLNYSTSPQQLIETIINLIIAEFKKNNIDKSIDSAYKKFIEINKDVKSHLEGADKLWFYLNAHCFWNEKNNIIIPVILFDQFERIFNTPNEKEFFLFLQNAVELRVPKKLLEKDFQYFFNESKTKFKLLIALQEDFLPDITMHEKEIPSLLRNKYRLNPFNTTKAKEAILEPAQKDNIVTENTALKIISYLSDSEERTEKNILATNDKTELQEIEPILLSVVCKKLNDQRKKEGSNQITLELLQRLTEKNKLLKDFYDDILSEIFVDEQERNQLKIIIEDNLLTESGKLDFVDEDTMIERLSFDKQDGKSLLDQLIRKRILRREPFLGKQRIYIIHNKLAQAIGAEKADRLFEQRRTDGERKIREAKVKAEKELELERLERKKNKLIFSIITIAALLIIAFVFIFSIKKHESSLQELNYKYEILDSFRSRNITARDLDSNLSKMAFDTLLALKATGDGNRYTNFLNVIDSFFQARNLIVNNNDQGRGLIIAGSVHTHHNIILIDSILQSIINETLIDKQIKISSYPIPLSSNELSLSGPSLTNNLLTVLGMDSSIIFNLNNKFYTAKLYKNSVDTRDSIDVNLFYSFDSLYTIDFKDYYVLYKTIVYNPSIHSISGLLSHGKDTRLFTCNNRTQGLKVSRKFDVGIFSDAYLSPNQKYLITYDSSLKRNNYKLWNLDGLKKEKNKNYDTSFSNQQYATNVKFSENSKKVMFLNYNNSVTVYKLKNNSASKIIYDINPPFTTIGFARDDTAVIGYTTTLSNSRVYLKYIEKDEKDTNNINENPLFISVKGDAFLKLLRSANNVSISKTGKTLLFSCNDGAVICKLSDSSNFFNKNIDLTKVKFKKLPLIDNLNTCLLNDSSLLSIDASGYINVWEIYPDFQSLNNFFSTVKNLAPTMDVLSRSQNTDYIRHFAETYYRRYFHSTDNEQNQKNLENSGILFRQLLSLDKNKNNKPYYLSRIFDIYEQLTLNDTSLENINSRYQRLDTIIKSDTSFAYLNRVLSGFYGSESWYLIQHLQPKLALRYAQYSINADSTNDFVYTNLALGYLLSGDIGHADSVYSSLKDSSYRTGAKTFRDAFNQDLNDLKKIRIINDTTPTNRAIWNEVKRIKKQILKVND